MMTARTENMTSATSDEDANTFRSFFLTYNTLAKLCFNACVWDFGTSRVRNKVGNGWPLWTSIRVQKCPFSSSLSQSVSGATAPIAALTLFRPAGNKDDKMLNSEIGIALGMPLHLFEEMKDPEVAEFRHDILQVCEDAVTRRNEQGRESQAVYAYPPEIENDTRLPPSLMEKLDKGYIKVAVWTLSEVNS